MPIIWTFANSKPSARTVMDVQKNRRRNRSAEIRSKPAASTEIRTDSKHIRRYPKAALEGSVDRYAVSMWV
jgi:hypothetical protein